MSLRLLGLQLRVLGYLLLFLRFMLGLILTLRLCLRLVLRLSLSLSLSLWLGLNLRLHCWLKLGLHLCWCMGLHLFDRRGHRMTCRSRRLLSNRPICVTLRRRLLLLVLGHSVSLGSRCSVGTRSRGWSDRRAVRLRRIRSLGRWLLLLLICRRINVRWLCSLRIPLLRTVGCRRSRIGSITGLIVDPGIPPECLHLCIIQGPCRIWLMIRWLIVWRVIRCKARFLATVLIKSF